MTPENTSHTDLMAQIEHMRAEQVQLRQEVADLRAAQKPRRLLPRLLSRSGLVVAISLLSVIALGGAAFASIPGPTGVIKGCYDKFGAVSVIDSAATATCPSKTTALTWSQAGIQGPQGIQGIQGPQGPQGPAGSANPLFCPNCDFRSVSIPVDATGAYFPNTNFLSANLAGAHLALANLQSADLDFVNLTNADLYHADLRLAILGGNLTGVDLVGANLTGADLSTSDLTNADLSSAVGLTGTTVHLVTWSNTICPDGTNSNFDGNTCLGHGIS